jgi:hypothetical protein
MKSPIRNEEGFSLPMVAMLGVVAGFWMLGMAAMVVPSMGRVTTDRARDVARSSAEAALDWGIQNLNDPVNRTNVDGKTNVTVPSELLGDPNYQAKLSVSNLAPPTNSYLYDPQVDPNSAMSTIQGGNGWRVLTATVKAPGSAVRTVRVILKPSYRVTNQPGAPVSQVVDGDPSPIFANAAFSQLGVGGTGNLYTNSYDSDNNVNPGFFQDKDGDVGSNSSIALKGNSHIGGDANIFSTPGETNTVASGTSNVTVSGNVNANGGATGFPSVDPSHVKQYLNNDPIKLPPVPSAPSGAADLGTYMNLAGNNEVQLSAKQAKLPDGTIINTSSGSYVVNSISMSGNSRVTVDPSYGPVNLYVQGAGSSSGISLTGNGVSGVVKPGDFRIWYGGTGPTKIAGNGSLRAVIYAPNSDFKQTGNGVLYGAVIANSINFGGNAMFHYDVALRRASELMYIPKITHTVPGALITSQTIDHYQAVTWNEF